MTQADSVYSTPRKLRPKSTHQGGRSHEGPRGNRGRHPHKGSTERRVALIVAERGLSEKQLAKYFVRRRKNCKPRFDHWQFAKDQDVSTDWLFDGDIRSYPRGGSRSAPAKTRTTSEAVQKKPGGKGCNQGAHQNVCHIARSSAEDIKAAMTTKHYHLAQFAEKYSVTIEWLICGTGRIADGGAHEQYRRVSGR
jgi:hypothetical protein